jgi:FAD/FMN-containing dehydrogenase
MRKGVVVSSTAQHSQEISITDLRSNLKGEVIGPDDAAYDEARQVFFRGVDRRPAAVARVAGADDVARVVTLARESGLELAVRSGGHSRAGYGTSEGGIVIDLSGMRTLEIDAGAKTARVETGITAGEYTNAVGERGRATGLGDTGSVGIGGITLAGGIGFLVRKYGLTIDDLLAAEVVTSDGEIVQTSEEPMPFIPEEAHGKPMLMGMVAYVGPIDQAEGVLAPFRALGEPYADMVRPIRYPEIYEGEGPPVRYGAGANFFADTLDPAAAATILEQLHQSTAMMNAVQLRVLGGALARVPSDATSFAHRDRGLFVNIAAMYMDPGEKDTHDAWVAGVADSLGKDEAGGYVGFLGEEDEGTVRAAYPGPTWDRLRELKRRYDPDNFFRLNHNIPPADG